MKIRNFWVEALERALESRSVVWLHGVRRAGKTVLCQSLPAIEYFDCERPRVRRMLEEPESFLDSLEGKRVVLDEVQRLQNPSELLKIAADHFPATRIIATGSSTLQASSKFRDTLTGRKNELWLTPMMSADAVDFGDVNLESRLRRGGLPPFFLNPAEAGHDFEEWLESYWARDIQELFRLERRWGFQRLLELLLAQSGGMFEATRFATRCEISRPTVANYVEVMDATSVIHLVRPFSSKRSTEIVSAPKIYGFDTGFVCHYRGWSELRPEDLGNLWEHYVLNEIHARSQRTRVHYWRDKRGHEVDFVLPRRGDRVDALECKWSSRGYEAKNLRAFRQQYPTGENWVVATDVDRAFQEKLGDLHVEFLGLADLARKLAGVT